MTADSSGRLAEASLARAERALRSAKLLLEHGELEDAASRAYYAMFYAARAALLARGVKAKSHKGVIVMFGKELVRGGTLGVEYADALRRASTSDRGVTTTSAPSSMRRT